MEKTKTNSLPEAIKRFWLDENGKWKYGPAHGFTLTTLLDEFESKKKLERSELLIRVNATLQRMRRLYGIQCGSIPNVEGSSVLYIISRPNTSDGAEILTRETQRAKNVLGEIKINSLNSPDPQVRAISGVMSALITMLENTTSAVLIPEYIEEEE